MKTVTVTVVLLVGGCERGGGERGRSEEAVFEACYRRCMQPPQGECPTPHDWCVVACRGGETLTVVPTLEAQPASALGPVPRRLASSIAIETLGDVATVVVPRCSALPVRVAQTYSTGEDNQATVQVRALVGDRPRASECLPLGEVVIEGVRAAPRGVPQIEVTFVVAASGQVTVEARDLDDPTAPRVQVLAPGVGERIRLQP